MNKIEENAQRVTQINSAFNIIMDAIPMGVIAFDSDARLIYVNPLASTIFAKSATELSGLRLGDFIGCKNRHKNSQGCGYTKSCVNCPLFRDLSLCLSLSYGRQEAPVEAEAFLERDTGLSNIWVKYKVSSFVMDNSKVAILTVEDITDRKQTYEATSLRKDKTTFPVQLQGKMIQFQNHPVRITALRDITERKRAEVAAQEAHQRLIAILDSMDAGVYVADMQNYELLFINRYMQVIYGDVIGKKCWQILQGDKTGPCEFCTNDRLPDTAGQLAGVYHWEIFNTKTGRWYECRENALRWIDGRIVRMGIAFDITDRKHAEESLRENEQKYRTLFEETLNPILMVDEKKRYIGANKAALEFLECDLEDLLHSEVWDLVPPDKLDIVKQEHAPFLSRRTIETEFFVHGAVKTLMMNVVPSEIKGETILYGIGQDITERKQAEEVIKTSLREKETLLKEVHHRVKNNMQVISSLLNLQIMKNKNEQARKALMDCQGRISSMASVHEMLYKSDSLSLIDCQAYISKLTKDIMRSYQTDMHRIKLTVDTKGVTLGVQQATPLGLIINELLSNALKYGFPENIHGRITIRLKLCENNIVKLVFSDDGIGIPEDLDWRNTKSLGLNLIVLLTENQLDGTVSLDRQEGTCFTIKFNRENNWPNEK